MSQRNERLAIVYKTSSHVASSYNVACGKLQP